MERVLSQRLLVKFHRLDKVPLSTKVKLQVGPRRERKKGREVRREKKVMPK
jgi:hypothetical protein